MRYISGKKLAMQELRIMIVVLTLNFEFLPLPEELSDMAGVEKLFRQPKQCHVKIRKLQTASGLYSRSLSFDRLDDASPEFLPSERMSSDIGLMTQKLH
jgi:hypothetical protein